MLCSCHVNFGIYGFPFIFSLYFIPLFVLYSFLPSIIVSLFFLLTLFSLFSYSFFITMFNKVHNAHFLKWLSDTPVWKKGVCSFIPTRYFLFHKYQIIRFHLHVLFTEARTSRSLREVSILVHCVGCLFISSCFRAWTSN